MKLLIKRVGPVACARVLRPKHMLIHFCDLSIMTPPHTTDDGQTMLIVFRFKKGARVATRYTPKLTSFVK